MKTTTSTAWPATDNRERKTRPGQTSPATVLITKEGKLLLKDASAAVTASVVVAEDHRQWIGQLADPSCQTQVSVAEVPNKQNDVRLQMTQKLLIGISP